MALKAADHWGLRLRTGGAPKRKDLLQKRGIVKKNSRHGDMKQAEKSFGQSAFEQSQRHVLEFLA